MCVRCLAIPHVSLMRLSSVGMDARSVLCRFGCQFERCAHPGELAGGGGLAVLLEMRLPPGAGPDPSAGDWKYSPPRSCTGESEFAQLAASSP